jgi:hypothetical protein
MKKAAGVSIGSGSEKGGIDELLTRGNDVLEDFLHRSTSKGIVSLGDCSIESLDQLTDLRGVRTDRHGNLSGWGLNRKQLSLSFGKNEQ